jgi:hypothetical protein
MKKSEKIELTICNNNPPNTTSLSVPLTFSIHNKQISVCRSWYVWEVT